MTNFIEDLYYGNIDPQNSGFMKRERISVLLVPPKIL